jgi:A/G-specific adenine glycosylase
MATRATSPFLATDAPALAARLLGWYDRNRRELPWRARPGAAADPYLVWLSEIMLQQTTIAAVEPYFRRFVARWPSVEALAAAPLDDVLHAWQGLGYYARARNLHRCAQAIARDHRGRFPENEESLAALPGIGPYTVAAIRAIAFDRPAVVVDGNVERVMARLGGIDTPLPEAKPALRALAAEIAPRRRAGDYAQALMELGQTVCTPRGPDCPICPWREACAARRTGNAETLPRRSPKPDRPLRRGVAFWAVREDGAVLLRRRAEKGLLGGMMEVPSTEWREAAWTEHATRTAAPLQGRWAPLPGIVEHGFTHFRLELSVMTARVANGANVPGVWCAPGRLADYALPTVMKKIVRHALAHAHELSESNPVRAE